jgi:hypothetical protein
MNTFLFRKVTPFVTLLGLGLTACQPDLEKDFEASRGTADFTRYIAVGNSLTAGFSDGGLYREGQLNSYPSILANQFRTVGGGEFNQPLFTEAQSNGSGYLRLTGFNAAGSPITANVTNNLAVRSINPTLYTRYEGRVDNLGVPGIRLSDIQTPGYGSSQGNAYFERITPTTTPTQTYFQRVKAEAATATFFSNWLGNNDILGFATAGAAGSSLTPVDTFRLKNNRIINVLTANGAKGIVATIPDVTNIPFFTTVGPTFRTTLTAANVAGVVITTGGFSATPGTTPTRRTIATTTIRDASGSGTQLFTLTAAPYLALFGQRNNGKAWRDVYNQARPSLPAGVTLGVFLTLQGVDTTQAFGASNGNPIPSTLVLDDTEQATIRTRTNDFNTIIINKANEKGLAVFDANSFFSRVASSGFVTNGVNNTAGFISGNLFSLDGVHPTPRGYAVVANEMIRAINIQYGASVPQINPNDYRGVKFPQ